MSIFSRFAEILPLHRVIRWTAAALLFLQPYLFFRSISQKHLLLSLKMAPKSSVELVSHVGGVWQSQGAPVFVENTKVDLTLPQKYDVLRLDFGSVPNATVELRGIRVRHWFYEYAIPVFPGEFYKVFDAPNQIIYFKATDSSISFRTGGNDAFFVVKDVDYFERQAAKKPRWGVIIFYNAVLAFLLLLFAYSKKIASGCLFLAKHYSCETKILAHKDDGLDQLTSLRFFAAMMIVASHSLGHMGLPDLPPGGLTNGVSFFFVLSGFILAYSYGDLSGKKQILNFYKNRIGRIWPLHLLLLALTLLFLYSNLQQRGCFQNYWILVTNLFLVHSWIPITEYNFSYNAVSWSISTEFFFYLCFPLLLKFKKTGTIMALLTLAGSIAVSNAGLIPQASDDSVSAFSLLYVCPCVRILEFICGMWICDWFSKCKLNLSLFAGTLLELLILAVTILYLCYLPKICSRLETVWGTGFDQYFSHCGSILIVPLLICVFACHPGWISRLLQTKPFVLAGEISFSIYLLHQPVIFYVQEHLDRLANCSVPQRLILVYAFIFVSAFLLWKFFETPVRKYVKKIQL